MKRISLVVFTVMLSLCSVTVIASNKVTKSNDFEVNATSPNQVEITGCSAKKFEPFVNSLVAVVNKQNVVRIYKTQIKEFEWKLEASKSGKLFDIINVTLTNGKVLIFSKKIDIMKAVNEIEVRKEVECIKSTAKK